MIKLIALSFPVDNDDINNPEELIAYCARVSSPKQTNPEYNKLLGYCAKNNHWSIFEMADMTVEIITSRAISTQILRHRSFSFQEFSQRYSESTDCKIYQARRQDIKNRQNSIDDLSDETKQWFLTSQESLIDYSKNLYAEAIEKGIAKECARFLLPLSTETRLYMKGSIRSFIHYCQVRCDKSTQLEHREIANSIKDILLKEFPSLKDIFKKEKIMSKVDGMGVSGQIESKLNKIREKVGTGKMVGLKIKISKEDYKELGGHSMYYTFFYHKYKIYPSSKVPKGSVKIKGIQ